MTNQVCKSLGACILALTLGQQSVFAVDTMASIPTELNPPAGNELFLKAQAMGTQNYICLPVEAGMKWTFLGPQATLLVTVKFWSGEIHVQVATHFLSPNPVENDTPRPTWQSSIDTSVVWGRAIASSMVTPGAIPWLLLQAVGSRPGPDGGSGFPQITFIQRLNTSGGVAPSTGCAVPDDMGHTAFVPYSTEYYFYKARTL